MSFTKEQILDLAKGLIESLDTPNAEPSGFTQSDLHSAYLLGIAQGLESQHAQIKSDLPTSHHIDDYAGDLRISGDIEIDWDDHDFDCCGLMWNMSEVRRQFNDISIDDITQRVVALRDDESTEE